MLEGEVNESVLFVDGVATETLAEEHMPRRLPFLVHVHLDFLSDLNWRLLIKYVLHPLLRSRTRAHPLLVARSRSRLLACRLAYQLAIALGPTVWDESAAVTYPLERLLLVLVVCHWFDKL